MGIDLDDAIAMAEDALDTFVVAQRIKDRVIGQYMTVVGPEMGRYLIVTEINDPTALDASQALTNARAI